MQLAIFEPGLITIGILTCWQAPVAMQHAIFKPSLCAIRVKHRTRTCHWNLLKVEHTTLLDTMSFIEYAWPHGHLDPQWVSVPDAGLTVADLGKLLTVQLGMDVPLQVEDPWTSTPLRGTTWLSPDSAVQIRRQVEPKEHYHHHHAFQTPLQESCAYTTETKPNMPAYVVVAGPRAGIYLTEAEANAACMTGARPLCFRTLCDAALAFKGESHVGTERAEMSAGSRATHAPMTAPVVSACSVKLFVESLFLGKHKTPWVAWCMREDGSDDTCAPIDCGDWIPKRTDEMELLGAVQAWRACVPTMTVALPVTIVSSSTFVTNAVTKYVKQPTAHHTPSIRALAEMIGDVDVRATWVSGSNPTLTTLRHALTRKGLESKAGIHRLLDDRLTSGRKPS